MILDWNLCRTTPFLHQKLGAEALVLKPVFALFDEMGAGKTKQVIDAAQFLFLQGLIHRVVVICPATVRSVWYDQELGELAKHLWDSIPSTIIEYHARSRGWRWKPALDGPLLQWYITNYDYLRTKAYFRKVGRRKIATIDSEFQSLLDPKTLIVFDESTALKNYKSQQSQAGWISRKYCGRVVLLNGTPVTQSPMDMYGQGRVMNEKIIGTDTEGNPISYFMARARYCVMAPHTDFPKVIAYQNLEDLNRRFAPYVLRRLKRDCLDLPEAMPPVNHQVPLDVKTWNYYKEMRDDLCIWLDKNSVTAARQAPVKVLRLAQITSGFVGGIEDSGLNVDAGDGGCPDWIPDDGPEQPRLDFLIPSVAKVRVLSSEKLDFMRTWLEERLDADPAFKCIWFFRFRPELARYEEMLREFKELTVGKIHGTKNKTERDEQARAKALLDPRTAPEGPAIVLAITQTGRTGLNQTAANYMFHISRDFSWFTYTQSKARIDRPGQTRVTNYFNLLATGPMGQKTVDHLTNKILASVEDVANWTTRDWVQGLRDE